ncbi:MAG: hypothetical protein GY953_49070, partial [bacterium]|nr:hypothetical protein [bacterium]
MRYLCLVLLLAVPMFGQTYGEITGNVTDSSGASIVAAEVLITNLATGTTRQVSTNEAGNYTVPFLSPGTYSIEVNTPGFKAAVEPNLIVQVGDVARMDFSMEVGAVTETIEIHADAEMLQTSSTSTGTVIEQKRIVDLPINGRNYLRLVQLSTNVTAEMGSGGQANSRQGGSRANQPISIAGQRLDFNRFTLDGVENTDPNFNSFIVQPSVDALQEFKVQTGVYSAEFGKATSQINVTTKGGTNQIHGTLFHFLRHDKIQAKPWNIHADKNPFKRNQFGFTLSGPAVKNKLFWMVNYEALRRRQSGVSQNTVADSAMRSGDFSALLSNGKFVHNQIFDPDTIREAGGGKFTADPFPGNRIPSSRFKQPFLQMFEFYPEPNVSGARTGIDPFNYVRNSPSPLDTDQLTTRIDWQESAGSQWFGRFSWGDEVLTSGQNFKFRDQFVKTKVWQIMLSNVRTLTPSLVNELRLGVNLFDNDKVHFFNGVRNVGEELNIPGLISPIQAAWGTPQMGFTGNNEVAGWG